MTQGPMASMDAVAITMLRSGIDLKGARVVNGFPSVGLVSTICANFLIDALKLPQIGVMDHGSFPTLSVIHDGEPLSPVRIYGREHAGGDKTGPIVVFVSEFQPSPLIVRPIGEAIVEWAKREGCEYIISPEGLVLEGEASQDDEVEVYAIGSTARMRKLIQGHNLDLLKEGILAGVCGIMLNVGKRLKYDVLAVLGEAHANYPDARSAAYVIDVITKLIGVKVDLEPLFRQAEGFEKQIKSLQRQAKASKADSGGLPQQYMYG